MRSCWSLRLSSFSFAVICLAFAHFSIAQFSLPNEIILNKAPELEPYLFPVNPGQPNFLAGTMGELRTTHFHAGIDVRTNSMIGVPILATQQGYVSRIIVGSYGYGHALMIKHPDGNTSLYGHLDKFKGSIARYVLEEQYKRKSFDLDINFEVSQFPIQRGDTIGLSGNTGGSNGPHLHFEIRDQNNEALNPLSFGFTEVKDKYSPIALKVALVTMDKNSRVNDRFGRFEFSLVRSGNNYKLPFPILATGRIGVEILAHDKIDLSQFRCGISQIEMRVDSARVFTQEINKFSFEDSYDIVTMMDFKTLKTKGARFNKLYVGDGNALKFYDGVISKGIIQIAEGQRKIAITLRDFSGNKSNVNFNLKFDPLTEDARFLEAMQKPIDFDIVENTLVINSKPCSGQKDGNAVIHVNGIQNTISPSYSNSLRNVYLIDLRSGLPDSIQTCTGTVPLNFKDIIPSGTDYDYYSDLIDIKFKNGNIYDTLYLTTSHEISEKGREKFTIATLTTPLHNTISITLKPTLSYPKTEKTFAYHIEGNRFEFVGGDWVNGRIQFNTKELGQFTILADSTPPSIGRIYCNSRTARFRIYDNLSGIAKYEANINGEWLLMKYDYKTGIVQSERLDTKKSLTGDFQLKVTDRAGNERIHTQKILEQKR
jgi:hypothetical protein